MIDHDDFKAWAVEYNEDIVFFDGYEDAFVGIASRCSQSPVVVYDTEKCIAILMARDGMDYDDAVEFFNFDTHGCWAGDSTLMTSPSD